MRTSCVHVTPRGTGRPRHPQKHNHHSDTTSGGVYMECSMQQVEGEPLEEDQRSALIQAHGYNSESRASSGAGQSNTSQSSAGGGKTVIKRTLKKQDSDTGRGRRTRNGSDSMQDETKQRSTRKSSRGWREQSVEIHGGSTCVVKAGLERDRVPDGRPDTPHDRQDGADVHDIVTAHGHLGGSAREASSTEGGMRCRSRRTRSAPRAKRGPWPWSAMPSASRISRRG